MDDALELVGTFSPLEWAATLIVFFDESVEKFRELTSRFMDGLLETLTRENREKAFDQIHPGCMGGSVVETDLGMSSEPFLDSRPPVGVEIVQDNVKALRRIGRNNLVHECDEIIGLARFVDPRRHFAALNVQRRQESSGSVPDIFISPASRF